MSLFQSFQDAKDGQEFIPRCFLNLECQCDLTELLLNTACNKFPEKGFEFTEAYPVKNPPSDLYNFPGPLLMYLKNGFKTHSDVDWYLVVRRRL